MFYSSANPLCPEKLLEQSHNNVTPLIAADSIYFRGRIIFNDLRLLNRSKMYGSEKTHDE